jgi:RNA polymerase sigma-70 factor (ECF subfamily)
MIPSGMADGPYAAFLAALPDDTRARFDDAGAAVLAGHDAAARAAWPDVEVAPDRFAAELGRRLGADAAPTALAAVHAADVYLAIAAVAGDAAAAAHVERDFLREADFAARKVRATQEQADDVKGHLRRILFTAEPGRTAGLAEFTGRGDLRGYVRVIATRELIRALERGRREVAVADDAVFDRFAPVSDAELSFVRRVTRDQVAAALRDALGRLEGHDRALLRYHLVDTWSIDRIAQVYGIHRATAARRLTAARDRLGELMRGELANRLAIADDEVASIVRLVQSKVEVSFERLLADNPADPDAPEPADD